jgi:hypothetical protein
VETGAQTHQKHHHPFSAPKTLIKKMYTKPGGKHQYQKRSFTSTLTQYKKTDHHAAA